MLWKVDISNCPYTCNLDKRLHMAKYTVKNNLVDMDNVDPDTFGDGKVSGYIDLGKTGIADKWQDIALCYRNLLHNFDGKYNGKQYQGFYPDMLFEKLEIEPTWDQIRYYILLDELF